MLNLPMLSTHKLYGDHLEGLYQLGLKDRDTYQNTHRALENFLKISNNFINKLQLGPRLIFARSVLKKNPGFQKKVEAYSQGLNISETQFAASMLIVEILSSLHFWPSHGVFSLLGCSSAFALNEAGQLIHGRILDFPLVGSFDLQERALFTHFKGQMKVFSIGSSGQPFHCLTTMNEAGITLALHQKYSTSFHPQGRPIFDLVDELITTCEDKKSVLKFLKQQKSMSSWSLCLGFKNGDVMNVDLYGDKLHKVDYSLSSKDIVYLNNLPLKEEKNKDILPWGLNNYCQMRTEAFKKVKEIKSEIAMIEALGAANIKASASAVDWKLPPRTPFSLTIAALNPQSESVHYIPGPAPKVLQNKISKISDVFGKSQNEQISITAKAPATDYVQGLTAYAKAQTALDDQDFHQAFHFIQLANNLLVSYPEGIIAQFFFLALQYLKTDHEKELSAILEKFLKLKSLLPPYLEQHCLLFIGRIQKKLNHPLTIKEKDFTIEHFRQLFAWEQGLKNTPFNFLKLATFIRLDLLDIIYLYAPYALKDNHPAQKSKVEKRAQLR